MPPVLRFIGKATGNCEIDQYRIPKKEIGFSFFSALLFG